MGYRVDHRLGRYVFIYVCVCVWGMGDSLLQIFSLLLDLFLTLPERTLDKFDLLIMIYVNTNVRPDKLKIKDLVWNKIQIHIVQYTPYTHWPL